MVNIDKSQFTRFSTYQVPKMRGFFLTGFVSCCVAVGTLLAVLYTQFDDKSGIDVKINDATNHPANLKRATNHLVEGFDNSTGSFTYVVFSDPQYGLRKG